MKRLLILLGLGGSLALPTVWAQDAKLTELTEATSLVWSNQLYATVGGDVSDSRFIILSNLFESIKLLSTYTSPMTASNNLYATETTRNAAVSNSLVAFSMAMSNILSIASSNNVRVVAGTGGITVDSVGSAGTMTHTVNTSGGAGGPTTNAPPYTIPIQGTNYVIDWLALGATNVVIITNFVNAGIRHTNITHGIKKAQVRQGNAGFYTVASSSPNTRFTAVFTGYAQSTNGGYTDLIVWEAVGTNAVLSGNNWGVAP